MLQKIYGLGKVKLEIKWSGKHEKTQIQQKMLRKFISGFTPITEILLKVELNTIKQTNKHIWCCLISVKSGGYQCTPSTLTPLEVHLYFIILLNSQKWKGGENLDKKFQTCFIDRHFQFSKFDFFFLFKIICFQFQYISELLSLGHYNWALVTVPRSQLTDLPSSDVTGGDCQIIKQKVGPWTMASVMFGECHECNCLHLGRIQRQPPDSCHILDIPVLIVYTTTMAFNICT